MRQTPGLDIPWQPLMGETCSLKRLVRTVRTAGEAGRHPSGAESQEKPRGPQEAHRQHLFQKPLKPEHTGMAVTKNNRDTMSTCLAKEMDADNICDLGPPGSAGSERRLEREVLFHGQMQEGSRNRNLHALQAHPLPPKRGPAPYA